MLIPIPDGCKNRSLDFPDCIRTGDKTHPERHGFFQLVSFQIVRGFSATGSVPPEFVDL